MHLIRLFATFIKVNLQQDLAYRADAIANMIISIMWLGWDLLSLSIIFTNTPALGGWGPAEIVALLGVWRLVNTLMFTVIWPNTERFNSGVRDGSLDYMFLQPANSQLLVSISRVVIWRAWDVILAITMIVAGIANSGGINSFLPVITFLALATSGAAIIYSLWIVLISLTYWFTKFDNNVTLMHALMDAGRYPAQVYPAWLRALITFVIPIAVATTIPMQALRNELAWWQVLGYLAIGAAAIVISSRIWKAGVRRYSGASA